MSLEQSRAAEEHFKIMIKMRNCTDAILREWLADIKGENVNKLFPNYVVWIFA